jgi:hypothetical protein
MTRTTSRASSTQDNSLLGLALDVFAELLPVFMTMLVVVTVGRDCVLSIVVWTVAVTGAVN